MEKKTLAPEELDKVVQDYSVKKAEVDRLTKEKDALRDTIIDTLKVTGEKLTGGNLSQKLPSGRIVLAEHKSRLDSIADKTIPFLEKKGTIFVETAMNRDEVNAAVKEGRLTQAEVDAFFKKTEFYQIKSYG